MSLPELEVKCWKCWGSGLIPWHDHGALLDCPECAGTGWLPTAEGQRLLDFVKRHLGIEFEEETNE